MPPLPSFMDGGSDASPKAGSVRGGELRDSDGIRKGPGDSGGPKRDEQGPVADIAREDAEEDSADLATIVRDLEADAELRVFLSPEFSPEAHLGKAVREERLPAALETATKAAELLNRQMRAEIIRRQDALLSGVENLDSLQNEISTVSEGVGRLSVATNGLEKLFGGPYERMVAALTKLENLHATAELLRSFSRALGCIERLRNANLYPSFTDSAEGYTSPEMFSLAASSLFELDTLLPSVSKLSAIAPSVTAIRKAKTELKRRAFREIRTALSWRKEAPLRSALVALNLLSSLEQGVKEEAKSMRDSATFRIARIFDPSSTSTVTLSNLDGVSSAAEADLLNMKSRVENMLKDTIESGQRTIFLEQVMNKREDELKRSGYGAGLYKKWLDSVREAFKTHSEVLLLRSKDPKFSSTVEFEDIVNSYPHLRVGVLSLRQRLPFCAQSIIKTLKGFEELYVTVTFSRITDAVGVIFASSPAGLKSAPSGRGVNQMSSDQEEERARRPVQRFIDTCEQELKRAKEDKEMYAQQAGNVAKGLRLFVSHASELCKAKLTFSVVSSKTRWEFEDLYKSLVLVLRSARKWSRQVCVGMGDPQINREIHSIEECTVSLVRGLFEDIRQEVGMLVLAMHPSGVEKAANAVNSSMFQLRCGLIESLYPSAPLGREMISFGRFILEKFVRNAVLLGFGEEERRSQVAKCAESLESAVGLICDPRYCGSGYQAIRSLRLLLSMQLESFKSSDDIQKLRKGLSRWEIVLYLLGKAGVVLQKEKLLKYLDWREAGDEKKVESAVEELVRQAEKLENGGEILEIIETVKRHSTE